MSCDYRVRPAERSSSAITGTFGKWCPQCALIGQVSISPPKSAGSCQMLKHCCSCDRLLSCSFLLRYSNPFHLSSRHRYATLVR